MIKAIQVAQSDFPRTPSILFCTWIVWLVVTDLLQVLGFLPDPASTEHDESIVVHYVKFKTAQLGKFNIMTGTQFPTNDGSPPEKEWCYVDTQALSGQHHIKITLALREGRNDISYEAISPESAFELGSTVLELEELARTHCHFYRG